MAVDFDAIVIGSGFGGAIVSCRLAEAGYRVLVLERGRRWEVKDYPRRAGDAWIWNDRRPAREHGWLDLRAFPHMTVVQGAAVGGGSLIYANISVEAKPDLFQQGWPPEITYDELDPFYKEVGRMLNVQQVPPAQRPPRTLLMHEAAQKKGYLDRFRMLDLAVTFDGDWNYNLPDPHDHRHSTKFINQQGQEQGTCIHLGNCDIGCDVKAKNTLDLNYIPRAEQQGAQVRPLHIVRRIRPVQGGYEVYFHRIRNDRLVAGRATARIVVLSAGSLGSTETLLRCRDEYKTLSNVSKFLGRNWSSNGDFLTPAFHIGRKVNPSRGPTITSAIDFLGDRNLNGKHFFIEDGGFPNVLRDYLEWKVRQPAPDFPALILQETIRHVLRQPDLFECTMPWFAQGRDAADGRLYLKKRPGTSKTFDLSLDWDIQKSRETIDAIVSMHESLARATGGAPFVPLTWVLLQDLITPHPLGGCNMSSTPQDGVVDHKGEVFGYRNLYVADGAIVPEAIGANPSRTIAALAERIAKIVVEEGR